MKILESIRKIAGFVIRYIPIALGFIVGALTNYQLHTIVDGVLGTFIVFFIYLLFLPEKIAYFKRQVMNYAEKKDIKYSIADFFLAIICYWSVQRVIDAILELLDILKIST